jgi:hypothetical protein
MHAGAEGRGFEIASVAAQRFEAAEENGIDVFEDAPERGTRHIGRGAWHEGRPGKPTWDTLGDDRIFRRQNDGCRHSTRKFVGDGRTGEMDAGVGRCQLAQHERHGLPPRR